MNRSSNVTVIIPCFNDGIYIVEALNSILNQTLKADKIIIIDDGSNIETKAILKTLKHETLEIISQENKGVCKTRNKGVSMAKTDYILNFDADDYFHNTFIEKAVKVLNNNKEVGVVGCYYNCFNESGVDENVVKPVGGTVKNFLVKNNGLGTSMFRKLCWEQVSGYDESMVNGYEDWDFWLSILSQKWHMFIIQEPLFKYRIKKSSRDQEAIKNHDFELRKYLYFKHKQVYLKHCEWVVLEQIRINGLLKNKIHKQENSINYKLGALLLKPIRYIKNIRKPKKA